MSNCLRVSKFAQKSFYFEVKGPIKTFIFPKGGQSKNKQKQTIDNKLTISLILKKQV